MKLSQLFVLPWSLNISAYLILISKRRGENIKRETQGAYLLGNKKQAWTWKALGMSRWRNRTWTVRPLTFSEWHICPLFISHPLHSFSSYSPYTHAPTPSCARTRPCLMVGHTVPHPMLLRKKCIYVRTSKQKRDTLIVSLLTKQRVTQPINRTIT